MLLWMSASSQCPSGLQVIHCMPPLHCVQVKYVVELARALGQHPAVYRVDLLTRLIKDPKVSSRPGLLCTMLFSECVFQGWVLLFVT